MKYLLSIILALLLSSALYAQTSVEPKTCAFTGRIADPLGAAIARAYILVHSDRWLRVNHVIAVNENGEFRAQLGPGLYDFFVGSPGFMPFAREIDLRSCKPVTLNVKMKVDIEHLED
jgi:Carboxypeptidase regulatory-like domain